MTAFASAVRFNVQLSHVDRGVYESLDLRTALHPSEKPERLVVRVLAHAWLTEPGLAFSRGGLSDAEEPALSVRDAGGSYRLWVDVERPSAARLHRAMKASSRVVVVTRGAPLALLQELSRERVHRVEELEVVALAPALVDGLCARLGPRGLDFDLTVSEDVLYATVGAETLQGELTRHRVGG